MDLEIIDIDAAVATGIVGPVIVALWRLPPTEDVVERALRAFDQSVARMPGRFGYLLVVEPTSPAPSGPVRARLEAHYDALASMVVKAAVLEGQPTWIDESLDVAIDITVLQSRARRTKVCVDAREAITWLTRQSELPVPDALRPALVHALERLRTSMPSA